MTTKGLYYAMPLESNSFNIDCLTSYPDCMSCQIGDASRHPRSLGISIRPPIKRVGLGILDVQPRQPREKATTLIGLHASSRARKTRRTMTFPSPDVYEEQACQNELLDDKLPATHAQEPTIMQVD
jgi:hypothetical protein